MYCWNPDGFAACPAAVPVAVAAALAVAALAMAASSLMLDMMRDEGFTFFYLMPASAHAVHGVLD